MTDKNVFIYYMTTIPNKKTLQQMYKIFRFDLYFMKIIQWKLY